MKGVLIELIPGFGASIPNVIAFQFNPETLRHSWTQPQASKPGSDPLAVQGMPGETFSFSLAMDATDQLALAENDPQGIDARAGGIYSRLAALEMLMFPADVNATSGLTNTSASTGESRPVPAAQLPAVLFVWGAGRIVPVRVTSLTITEKLFDKSLNPTHADAQIELSVLTPSDFGSLTGPLKTFVPGAYKYSQGRRMALAILNLNNAAGSIDLPVLPGF